jgi:hypothetical protein
MKNHHERPWPVLQRLRRSRKLKAARKGIFASQLLNATSYDVEIMRRLMWAGRLAAISIFLLAVAVFAHAADGSNSAPLLVRGLGTSSVPLDGPWSFRTGDDLSWASPAFDDSSWTKVDIARPWGDQGFWAYSGFAWYRRHVDFGQAREVAIFTPTSSAVYQLFWNGRLVADYGPLPSNPGRQAIKSTVIRIEDPGSGVLAFRACSGPNDSSTAGDQLGLMAQPIAANPEAAGNLLAVDAASTFRDSLAEYTQVPFYAELALLGALVWLRNRGQKLLFWMVLYCVSSVFYLTLNPAFAAPWLASLPILFSSPFHSLNDVALWYLLIYLLNLDSNVAVMRWTRIVAWVVLISAFCDDFLFSLSWASTHVPLFQMLDAIFTASFSTPEVLPLILVLLALRKRLSSSRWSVAIAAFLYEMWYVIWHSSLQGQRFTHSTLGADMLTPLARIDGVPVLPQTILSMLLIVTIVYAVYRYIAEESQRQRAIREEFKSAQELQRVLIPEALPALPGFAVTSAYRPAAEVGGDFFQLIAVDEGSALLAIGDVSGKGLKAAMTVSLIVGALRTLADSTSQPEEILAGLNRRLCGRLPYGFVTCLVMRLSNEGECLVASAGHPAPFLNDAEIAVPAALPLGLDAEQSYRALPLGLHVGDRLTVYTDGLLEARNAEGELFGFERLEKLVATRPDAVSAVETAVAFGQEDDVTVLTLTRLAGGVESTTSLRAPELEPSPA